MLDRWIGLALLGGVVCSLISIFVSGIFYCVAISLWFADCWKHKTFRLEIPPFSGFLLAFFLAVLAAVVFSADIVTSIPYLKKFIKFGYIFLIFTYVGRRQVEPVLKVVFAVLGVSSLYAILQYYWLLDISLLNRVSGFMSHWMTFSGQLMLCSVALTGYLLFYRLPPVQNQAGGRHEHDGESLHWRSALQSAEWLRIGGWVVLLGILLIALILTHTRSAWFGTIGGLFLLLWIYRFRWMMAGIGIVVIIFLALPGDFKQRLYSSFDLSDTTTRIRIELFNTGTNIVQVRPWWGLGPRMVPRLYDRFNNTDEFPIWIYQHLHNNFMQIAAEMGLITLGIWLALWARLLRDFVRFLGSPHPDRFSSCVSIIGIAAVSSFLLAGLFEYNFGDSEILILLLFFITIPYVVKREQEKTT